MKRRLTVFSVIGAFLAIPLAADEHELQAHRDWMDEAQDLQDTLKVALPDKDAKAAAETAEKLVSILEREQKFWAKTNLKDAIKLADGALAASRDLAKSAKAANFDQAKQDYSSMIKNCMTCHDAHYEEKLK
jgi:hypothetical protein